MHQIVLSESAAAEMAHFNKLRQLEIVAEFTRLRKEPTDPGKGGISATRKGHRTIYRCRTTDYRIYFEKEGDQLVVHHVLHRNTLRDFMVRSNLDIQNDDEFEETAKFWKFIEQRQVNVKVADKP